ncbi:MAG: MBL fold metallo-hydrolase [Candidatus Adiutricales bacterium]
MTIMLKEVDRVEILTLQDNYIDLLVRDNNEVIQRAMIVKGTEIRNSVLAEHGFSALVTTTVDDRSRSLLFDFGFSPHGAASNAQTLEAGVGRVEVLALSHGHMDHVGGLNELAALVERSGIEMIVHPEAFRNPRYFKIGDDLKIVFPPFTREKAESAGVRVVETSGPYPLLDNGVLFLGEIKRSTDFEKGAPSLWYGEGDQARQDTFEDDTGLAFLVKGRGLVVLTGCAHAGIINTVYHAREIAGMDKVLAVMGGFHLSGPDQKPVIKPTIERLKELAPDYIIPTHCTGREAIGMIEEELPDSFILNMSGTKLTFSGLV